MRQIVPYNLEQREETSKDNYRSRILDLSQFSGTWGCSQTASDIRYRSTVANTFSTL